MDAFCSQQQFLLETSVRCIETATRRFAKHAPQANDQVFAIVLLGPTAADKANLARRLHGVGPRANRSFVRIDCRHPAGVQFATLNGVIRNTRPIAGADEPPRHFLRVAAGGTLFFDHWNPAAAHQCAHLLGDLKSTPAVPLAAADPFCIDAAVTVSVDVHWTDGSEDDECMMLQVPLPLVGEYLASLVAETSASLLAAN